MNIQQELASRISLFAWKIEEILGNETITYDMMKTAYKKRSSYSHGGSKRIQSNESHRDLVLRNCYAITSIITDKLKDEF